MKKWLINLSLLFISIIISVLLIEYISRIIFPVSAGVQILSMDNKEIILSKGIATPGTRYRIVTNEYDAVTTITDLGYRAPEVTGNPDVIFIGDSFTFGMGVKDDDTFVYQYCSKLQISCVNLGTVGSGTIRQVNRLESFLISQKWRPKEVKLFIMAMTRFLSHGNDLSDNLRDKDKLDRFNQPKRHSHSLDNNNNIRPGKNVIIASATAGGISFEDILDKIISHRHIFVEKSNLLRIIYYYWGVELRTLFSPKSKEDLVNKALDITRIQLMRLEELSRTYNFRYKIFLIHPMQDIAGNTYKQTYEKIQSISLVPVHGTGHLFESNPGNYYFPADGHLNVEGNRKMAEFLLSLLSDNDQ